VGPKSEFDICWVYFQREFTQEGGEGTRVGAGSPKGGDKRVHAPPPPPPPAAVAWTVDSLVNLLISLCRKTGYYYYYLLLLVGFYCCCLLSVLSVYLCSQLKKSCTKIVFVFEISMYESAAFLFSSYFHCFSCSYQQTDPQSLQEGSKQKSARGRRAKRPRGKCKNARANGIGFV
jgi:hypothetical protein